MDSLTLIIGLVAAFLTTFAYLPQFIKTLKTKHTKDLSLITLIMLDVGILTWLIYGLIISSIPVIVANTVSLLLISIILYLKIKYH